MTIPNYDSWKLSSGQDDEIVVCNCLECDGEIYDGEEAIAVDDGLVHEECFEGYAFKQLGAVNVYATPIY